MADKDEFREIVSQTREYLEFYRELGLTEIGGSLRTGAPEAQVVVEPSRRDLLQEIRDDIGDCKRCRLCEQRTNIVFGEGSPNAELMFVGEGPGADEDAQGRPFVGKSGQLLTKIIEAIGLKRESCYIANTVKCRPPDNRTPQPDEIATCEGFLFRQIRI